MEVARRQQMRDGLLVASTARDHAPEDAAAKRQAEADAVQDRQRRIQAEDMEREFAPFAPGDLCGTRIL